MSLLHSPYQFVQVLYDDNKIVCHRIIRFCSLGYRVIAVSIVDDSQSVPFVPFPSNIDNYASPSGQIVAPPANGIPLVIC